MKRYLLIIFALLSANISRAQEFDYSFKETYEVSTPAQLDLSSADGNLDVISSEGNKIEVFYIVKQKGRLLKIDRRQLEEELIVESDYTKNSVKISVKNKYQTRAFGNFDLVPNVHFKVYVPRETACRLTTSDGNISMAKLTSNQECKTSDGSIEVLEVSGNIYAKTSDGDIRVRQTKGVIDVGTSDGNIEMRNVVGDVEASTSDGNIRLEKVKGNVAVKTSDGFIGFNEVSGSVKASTSDGDIKGNIIDLREALTLKTSDGNIEISLPEQVGLDLDIKAESIDVPFKNFTGKFDKKHVSGKSNGGGIPVVLTTSGGKVSVSY